MNKESSFAPTLMVDGITITPKGYIWILGFALHGCEWAIKEASKPEFLEMIRADLKQEEITRLEAIISRHKKQIEEKEKEIDLLTKDNQDQ